MYVRVYLCGGRGRFTVLSTSAAIRPHIEVLGPDMFADTRRITRAENGQQKKWNHNQKKYVRWKIASHTQVKMVQMWWQVRKVPGHPFTCGSLHQPEDGANDISPLRSALWFRFLVLLPPWGHNSVAPSVVGITFNGFEKLRGSQKGKPYRLSN